MRYWYRRGESYISFCWQSNGYATAQSEIVHPAQQPNAERGTTAQATRNITHLKASVEVRELCCGCYVSAPLA